MLERLRERLVESYVGAIGLGLLLANLIGDFANGFTTPLQDWISRTTFNGFVNRPPVPFRFNEGAPQFAKAFILLLIWCLLFYWLYLRPLQTEMKEEPPSPDSQLEEPLES